MFWGGSKTRLRDCTDGTSNTIAFAESTRGPGADGTGTGNDVRKYRLDATSDVYTDLAAATPPYANVDGYRLTSWLRGIVPFGPVMNGYLTPNSDVPDVILGSSKLTAARSYHRGGAQVVTLDGSVHFISDSVDTNVYRGSWTASGGEVEVPF